MTSPPAGRIVLVAVVVLLLAGLRLAQPPPPEPGSLRGDAGSGTAGAGARRPPSPADRAVATARSFLDEHVTADGRVVRADQGGDTVSEGQAWALLVAVALDDRTRATAVAEWTEDHLARDDGLLAWRWADGERVDGQPASDADLVYAWALDRGGERFARPAWRARARQVLGALADASTAPTPAGPVLVAGPWATGADGGPTIVNPSYLWPAALRWAGRIDPRLEGLDASARTLLGRLVGDDTPLVPDWVRLDDRGRPTAIGGPGAPDEPPRHGLDAVRTWLWLASDCDPAVRALAGAARGRFPADPEAVVAVHDLAGVATVGWRHAATLAGAAAVAQAAGDPVATRARLRAAAVLERDHPGYYGAAVLTLAGLLLDTDLVVDCAVSG